MLHTLLFSLLYTSCMCIFEILCDIVLPRLSFQLLFQWSHFAAAAAAKSLQLCLTLCDPTDRSPPGSPVPGILQARILEWVAISFSNAWKWKVKAKSLSRVWLLATPWTAAYQAPLSMGFSRQEYWSGVPLPSPWVTITNMQIIRTLFVMWATSVRMAIDYFDDIF